MNKGTTFSPWRAGLSALSVLLPALFLFPAQWSVAQECLIEGPTASICPGEPESYLLNYPLLSNQEVTWLADPGTVVQASGPEAQVSWEENGQGEGSLVAVVSTEGGVVTSCTLMVDLPSSRKEGIIIGSNGCVNSTQTLSVKEVFEGEAVNVISWFLDPNSAGANLTGNGNSAQLTFLEAGVVDVCIEYTLGNGTCVFEACRRFTAHEVVNPDFSSRGYLPVGGAIQVCAGQEVYFENTTQTSQSPTYNWTVSGNPPRNFNSTDLAYVFVEPGVYQVSLEANNRGCISDPVSLTVIVEDLPAIEISCPSVVCAGEEVTYSVPDVCGNYSWSFSPLGSLVEDNGNQITIAWGNASTSAEVWVSVEVSGCNPEYCSAPSVISFPLLQNSAEIDGPDFICNGLAQLYSLPDFPGASYSWSLEIIESQGGDAPTLSSAGSRFANLFPGDFNGIVLVTVEVSNPLVGCDFTATKEVVIGDFEISAEPALVCADNPTAVTFTISPTAVGTIEWTFSRNGQVFFSDIGSGSSYTLAAQYVTESFRVEAVISGANGACEISRNFPVGNPASIDEILGEFSVCPGQEYEYQVLPSGGGTLFWEAEGGVPFFQIGNPITVVWQENAVDPVLRVSRSENSCQTSQVEVPIEFLDNTALEITGEQAPCPDTEEIYVVDYALGEGYSWSVDPDLGSIISGQGTPEVAVLWHLPPQPTMVDLKVVAEVCDGDEVTATLPITLTPFELGIEGPELACEGEAVTFASSAASAGSYTWYVNGEEVPGNETMTHAFTQSGYQNVQLKVTDPEDCPGQHGAVWEIYISPNPKPNITALGFPSCPEGSEFEIQLFAPEFGNMEGSYTWELDGMTLPGDGSSITISQIGTYTVTVDNGACTNSDEITIDYSCDSCLCNTKEIPVPTVFPPQAGETCGTATVEGLISPWAENIINARWVIGYAGDPETYSTFPVNGPDDLQVELQFPYAGYFPAVLEVTVACPKSRDTCVIRDGQFVYVPAFADFDHRINCDPNGYVLQLIDNSSYVAGVSEVNLNWTVDGQPMGSGSELEVSVNANSEVEVCLEVSTAGGYSCQSCGLISIPPALEVDIQYDNSSLCEGVLIDFFPQWDPGQIVDYIWNFGDGSLSRLPQPTKQYPQAGTYTVELAVLNFAGCTQTVSVDVVIQENTLNGSIGATLNDCKTEAELEFIPAAGANPTSYEWSPGGYSGSPITVSNSGNYFVTVTDGIGCTFVPAPQLVTLQNPFPNNPFQSSPAEVCEGNWIFFSINNFGFPEDDYVYEWSSTLPGSEPQQGLGYSLFPQQAGIFEVTLSAYSLDGNTLCGTASTTIEVIASPPEPVLQVSYSSCDPYVAEITVVSPPSNVEIEWSGPFPEGTEPSGNVATVYEAGNYRVTFTNSAGCTSTASEYLAGPVDFSGLFTGCYEFCEEDVQAGLVIIEGINQNVDSWQWIHIDENGNETPLASGSNPVIPLQVSLAMEGTIILSVEHDGCTYESDPINITIVPCTPPCGFITIEETCLPSGMVQLTAVDENGVPVDPTQIYGGNILRWWIYGNGPGEPGTIINDENPVVVHPQACYKVKHDYLEIPYPQPGWEKGVCSYTTPFDCVDVKCEGPCADMPTFLIAGCGDDIDLQMNLSFPEGCNGICNGSGTIGLFHQDGTPVSESEYLIEWEDGDVGNYQEAWIANSGPAYGVTVTDASDPDCVWMGQYRPKCVCSETPGVISCKQRYVKHCFEGNVEYKYKGTFLEGGGVTGATGYIWEFTFDNLEGCCEQPPATDPFYYTGGAEWQIPEDWDCFKVRMKAFGEYCEETDWSPTFTYCAATAQCDSSITICGCCGGERGALARHTVSLESGYSAQQFPSEMEIGVGAILPRQEPFSEPESGPEQSLTIFPNPFGDYLNISWTPTPELSRISCTIYDPLGRQIKTMQTAQSNLRIRTGDLPPGIFLISIYDEEGNLLQTEKIIKANR